MAEREQLLLTVCLPVSLGRAVPSGLFFCMCGAVGSGMQPHLVLPASSGQSCNLPESCPVSFLEARPQRDVVWRVTLKHKIQDFAGKPRVYKEPSAPFRAGFPWEMQAPQRRSPRLLLLTQDPGPGHFPAVPVYTFRCSATFHKAQTSTAQREGSAQHPDSDAGLLGYVFLSHSTLSISQGYNSFSLGQELGLYLILTAAVPRAG